MEHTGPSGSEGTGASPAAGGASPGTRSDMLAMLDELLSLAAGLLADGARRSLAAGRERVAEDRFNLVVLGEFKRGKSTLINALLQRDVLSTGVLPLTVVVTVIGAGDRERLVIRYVDGREVERPVAELAEYVTETLNPGNDRGVELARGRARPRAAARRLELVDTPGSAPSMPTTPRSPATSCRGSTRRCASWTPDSCCQTANGSCSWRRRVASRGC